ncbi:MAG TPA: hypothetical protein VL854_01495 [Nitrososphaeraceae archaeon]|nr:hypothetical protein [Nitrososphaeraceae archaeon]
MTIQKTVWYPIFCDCTMVYTWDDSVPIDQRQHIPHSDTQVCEIHSILSDNNSTYSSILNESSIYLESKQILIDNGPTTLYDIQVNGFKTLKSPIELRGQFSGQPPNRILTITLVNGPSLTTNQKNSIQNKLDTRFGTGKIVFVAP